MGYLQAIFESGYIGKPYKERLDRMDSVEAVSKFIKGTIESHRARRLLALVATKKGRRKFLSELHHGIESDVRKDVIKLDDLSSRGSLPCYVYRGPGGFGAEKVSVNAAYDSLSVDDSWLIVSQDGRFAIYRPEARWDSEIIVAI